MIDDPDLFARRLKAAFKPPGKAAFFGRPFRYLGEVASTNDVAAEWAATGAAPEGAMVMAAAQTAGRGRAGRSWVSAAGAGLWFSLVLQPDLAYPEAGMLPLVMGYGLVDALRELGLPAALKWPNDVVVRGRKLCGVLVEGKSSGGRLVSAVAGVGMNWTLPEIPGLRTPATALVPEFAAAGAGMAGAAGTEQTTAAPGSGPPIPPEVVLVSLLGGIEKAYLLLKMAGPAPFVATWPRISAHFARPVLVLADPSAEPKGPAKAHPADSTREALGGRLHDDGSLEVITAGGRRQRLVASEVSLGSPRA